MYERICLSKTENRSFTREDALSGDDFIQGWAFTSVRSPVGAWGYESGDRWSAASEGVLAALRLSKSAQSADKVHFSDSTELR